MSYKVLITTSGVGSRLGELTKYTNKSLVRIGKKPALSYIIESYPKDIELVITVGYFADQVKEFVEIAYPERRVTFVVVDKYEGEGSSLGYSMLQAKKYLQCPFIFHAADTVVHEDILEPTCFNWNGGFKDKNASSYTSFTVINDKVGELKDRGAIDFDLLHIGLVGIKDYKEFWEALEKEYKSNPDDSSLNDCRAINAMLKKGIAFKPCVFKTWLDIGNVESLENARKNIYDHDGHTVLDKVDESIFFFDNFVVKFFYDPEVVTQRVKRARILKGLVPNIEKGGNNFYRYAFVEGETYSQTVTPSDFISFLEWSNKNLWKKNKEVDDKKFKKICNKFYKEKTEERVKRFFEKKGIKDSESIINGEKVPTLKKILEKVDFDWLSEAEQYQFHGDFILDNILKTKKGYCLTDWRQNFGGLLQSGDMYYDLAKLNHNLTVNHDIVNDGLFNIEIINEVINCDIMRRNNLVMCQDLLYEFLLEKKYDIKKVKILTAIIWLNMSPLHHHPFDLFLYYFGKLQLWQMIKK